MPEIKITQLPEFVALQSLNKRYTIYRDLLFPVMLSNNAELYREFIDEIIDTIFELQEAMFNEVANLIEITRLSFDELLEIIFV